MAVQQHITSKRRRQPRVPGETTPASGGGEIGAQTGGKTALS